MSTYLTLYVESLEERIERGGTQEDVDQAFAEYNAFDQEAFARWLAARESVMCTTCGAPFKPEGQAATAEVLCKEHASP